MSELKCIYWENATPDDFINARRGETWIQGVGEIDTLYAENLVHNFGKAWKEKLTPAPPAATTTGFELSKEDREKVAAWKDHGCSLCEYSGAIGGRLTFSFTPTGLGEIVKVKCGCGRELDLTDTDSW